MSSNSVTKTFIIIIPTVIILFAVINTVVITAVRESELSVMLGVLRARGYHLFANAIATSDIHYDLRSDSNNSNFTLLAPINSALFALDMTMPATNYVSTLRYHIVPRRMSMIDLLSLPPSDNAVPTLVPGRDVRVEQRRSVRSLITVGGVDIVVPGLFYGRNVAVHGLGGILEYRHHRRSSPENSPANFSGNVSSQSPPVYNITGNYTFRFPVAIDSPVPSRQSENENTSVTSADRSWIEEEIDKNYLPLVTNEASIGSDLDESKRRGKLLEVSDLNGDCVEEIVMEDDETLGCSLNEDVGDVMNMNAAVDTKNMICAQR